MLLSENNRNPQNQNILKKKKNSTVFMQIGFILGLSLIADFKIQKCNFLSLSPRSSGTGGLGWRLTRAANPSHL